MPTPIRKVIHWNDEVFTYTIEDGEMIIYAQVTMHGWVSKSTETEDDLLNKIMQIPGLQRIKHSKLFPLYVVTEFNRYKRAVDLIESAVLNPKTVAGRRRLEREFTLLIGDL